MFSGFMLNTWVAATLVALVAGGVGFFVVLRNSSFVAHAVPHGAFGGAAGAALLGWNTVLGLGVFAVGGALGIGWLSRRGRHDVGIALALVTMLGTGALFLGWSGVYAEQVYALLFGALLGVARSELWAIAGLCLASLLVLVLLYRPLLATSVLPGASGAGRRAAVAVDTAFLLLVALATSMSVPVVGALLMFSLMVGPPAAARLLTDRPLRALMYSVVLALGLVWVAVAASYALDWPVGFFVGTGGAVLYGAARLLAAVRRRARPASLGPVA